MKSFPNGAEIVKEDIDNIKLLGEKGLSPAEIVKITKWSRSTVARALSGYYDARFAEKKEEQKQTASEELKDLMAKNLEILIKIDGFLAKESEVVK
ncbi:MAG: helix-turn-helix domain-containing protein [Firmicutes bacterium]|nr:helix-turn-helix domain-containing protein [Bacillota bacterium]